MESELQGSLSSEMKPASEPVLSGSDIRSMLEMMPSMGYAYEDIPAFLENVVTFLKSHFGCRRVSLILSRAYGGSLGGDALVSQTEGEGPFAGHSIEQQNEEAAEPRPENGGSDMGKGHEVPLPFRDLLENHSPSSEQTQELKEICLEINRSFSGRTAAPNGDSKRQNGPVLSSGLTNDTESYVRALDQIGFEFIYPILLQRDLVGLILLGGSSSGFREQDTLFVEMGSALLALTLRNAAIRRENSRLRLNQVRSIPPTSTADSQSQEKSGVDHGKDDPRSGTNTRRQIQVGNRSIVVADNLWHYSLETWSRLATVDVPILISGETGTGKELFARWIHQESGSTGPFVPINCASVPDTLWESELFGHVKGAFTDARERRRGLVEVAADGILFFDEIGDMPLDMQGKLLRLIQERQFRPLGASNEVPARCRFLFATHRNLSGMIKSGDFRQDLFYRISTLTERIPPLRERSGDILALLDYYLELNARKYRIQPAILSQEIRNAALAHFWPGNVRELESLALRLSLEYPGQAPDLQQFHLVLNPARRESDSSMQSQDALTSAYLINEKALSDLGLASGITMDFDHLVQNYSKQILKEALERSEGNRTRAAQQLGISRGRFNYQWKLLFGD